MERFKKRTLALVLASVVTVVGAFGSDNYKNSLMGLNFEPSENGGINMVVQTKIQYSGNISPVKKDTNTYVLMLPEMNSLATTPDLKKTNGNIVSVNIRTMPYSNTAKGYTKITIKTASPTLNLIGQTQVYVPSKNSSISQINTTAKNDAAIEEAKKNELKRQQILAQREAAKKQEALEYKKKLREAQKEAQKEATTQRASNLQNNTSELGLIKVEPVDVPTQTNTSSNYYLWLLAILIVLSSLFYYVRAKNKIQELAGERFDIDTEEDSTNYSKSKKIKQIKNTIKTLDKTYNKTSIISNSEYTINSSQKNIKKIEESYEIVDLDKLFQEKQQKNSIESNQREENDALEDFLSGFSFIEDEFVQKEQDKNESLYDEELYNHIIKNNNLIFSNNDITCINQLLNAEINDETIRNIEKYAISNPIKKVIEKDKILEDLVLSYSISQKLTFSKDDINILQKLISVELDEDFVSDLRTNPQRTSEMQQDILDYGDKPKKPSEIITLNVKDLLPDLTDALKKQNGKKIESNHRAETVFFSEGYEVQTLSLSENLPDLSLELNKKNNYKSKPSAEYEIVDTNFVIGAGELKISTELPDLQDAIANPEKYIKTEKEVVVDEEALLNNILNVEFKPFYDGTNEFEVLNHFEDTPSVSDIQEEFSQFTNFIIENPEEEEETQQQNVEKEYDDFQDIYNNEYVDLNSPENLTAEVDNLEKRTDQIESKTVKSAAELLKKIETTKLEREERKTKLFNKITNSKKNVNKVNNQSSEIKCMLDGESLTILSSANLIENKGCHLAKGANGYFVLGYVNDKFFKIKTYENLKSEKIQGRQYEVLQNGDVRFIVRIGLNKFIVDVSTDSINYVMDLC